MVKIILYCKNIPNPFPILFDYNYDLQYYIAIYNTKEGHRNEKIISALLIVLLVFPLASTMLEGSLNIVFDMLIGKTADVNFNERVPMRLIQSADSKKFTVEQYPQKYNVYMCYTEGFENI